MRQSFINSISKICFLVVFFVVCSLATRGQNQAFVTLNADELQNEKSISLTNSAWKYRAGDSQSWAARDFDDRHWKSLTNDEINSDLATLENWNGQAWFRLHVAVDDNLANQPLAMRVWNWGAAEIYIDGKLVERFGVVGVNGEEEFNPRGLFVPIVFVGGGTHVIAVRHSFQAMSDLTNWRSRFLFRNDYAPGFRMVLEPAQGAAVRMNNLFQSNKFEYVFVGLLAALAAVHLLLFAFYPAERGNLYYSFFVGGLALTIFLNRFNNNGNIGAEMHLLTTFARNIGQVFAVVSLLPFLYIEFVGRVSRFFWLIVVLWVIALSLTIAHVSLPFPYFLIMLGVTFADCLRIIIQSLVKRLPGAWNIAAGVGLLVFGVANNIAFERDAHFLPAWLYEYNLYGALLSVPIAVSIYLARRFAQTNKNLAVQLEKEVEHEKEKARLLVVEAENERRAKELEEARQLQLSMLPKKLPRIEGLDIAAYMKPATEVGGDYYDFHVSDDGTLTVAVGDATGHGLKAGTVVTATKSLFNNLAREQDITSIFKQLSAALKAMNLRGLFMAMTMLKINGNRAIATIAGMPSILIYRAATGKIEEVAIRAMPLGGFSKYSYIQQELNFSAGDSIVLMSDGFPEMFNEAGEMIAEETAKNILIKNADQSAEDIINRFVEVAEKWAGKRPPDDDVTFVVLKVKTDDNKNL